MRKKIKAALISIIDYIIKLLPERLLSSFYLSITREIEKKNKLFITFHDRPKFAESIKIRNDDLIDLSNVFIVIQGPIIKIDDFTLNTIQLYKKFFKNVKIILSTWDDENSVYLEKFKQYCDFLILNKKPKFFGFHNINLQIISSKTGILKAKDEKSEFILKTRTDQRIYNPNIINYFISLLTQYDNKDSIKKIVISSLGTLKNRPFGVSDMLMFGFTSDMVNYWDVPLDTRDIQLDDAKTVLQHAKKSVCEVYLATHYLKKLGKSFVFSLSDTWKIYVNYFIIVDMSIIDIYWIKYDRRNENKYNFYDGKHSFQSAKITDWLPRLIFNNMNIEFDIKNSNEGQFENN